jgi:hypothetical protein
LDIEVLLAIAEGVFGLSLDEADLQHPGPEGGTGHVGGAADRAGVRRPDGGLRRPRILVAVQCHQR